MRHRDAGKGVACSFFLVSAFLAVYIGCDQASNAGEQYSITPTGISVISGLSYSWCDNAHIAVDIAERTEKRSQTIYIDVNDTRKIQKIDIVNEQLQRLSSGVGKCEDGTIIAGGSVPGKSAAFLKGDRSATFYTVRPGQQAELLVSFKVLGGRPVPPVNLKEKYVIGHAPKILTGQTYHVDTQCATYVRPDFKLYCWDTFNRTVWPLSRFVLTEYNWQEQVTVQDMNGQVQQATNQEPPLLGKDGKPLRYALFLHDFNNQILVNLYDDPVYKAVPVHGVAFSSDERYMYSVCGKWNQQFDDATYICRYLLDGQKHPWEEVFAWDPKRKPQVVVIRGLSVSSQDDVYFDPAGTRHPNNGIWKVDAKTKQLVHVTTPKSDVYDQAPKVSPDGKKIAFIREDKNGRVLCIAQQKGAPQ